MLQCPSPARHATVPYLPPAPFPAVAMDAVDLLLSGWIPDTAALQRVSERIRATLGRPRPDPIPIPLPSLSLLRSSSRPSTASPRPRHCRAPEPSRATRRCPEDAHHRRQPLRGLPRPGTTRAEQIVLFFNFSTAGYRRSIRRRRYTPDHVEPTIELRVSLRSFSP